MRLYAAFLPLLAPVLAAKPATEPQLCTMAGFLHGLATDRRKLTLEALTNLEKSRANRQHANDPDHRNR